jgi:hypothetical protein
MVVVMALATVTFWGEGNNTYGIPNTLYTYLISVSTNQIINNKDRIVKIVPLTGDTPKPERDLPFIVKNSDANRAMNVAFGLLESMESLKGLKNHKNILELDKQNNLHSAIREFY